jgi:tetratricopeptide (TPR) repeat protein
MVRRSALIEFLDTNKGINYSETSTDKIISTTIFLIWTKNFKEALSNLETENIKNPGNMFIEKYLGIVKENLKRIPEAVKHYSNAIKIAEKDSELYDSFIKEMIEKIKHLNF